MGVSTSAIYGCAGASLNDWERSFFQETRPWGFILFSRNIADRESVRRLTDDLRDTIDDPDALIFVDQEGGLVARLKGPHFRHPPAPRRFADAYLEDPETAAEAMWLNARLMADDLRDVGINANCAPMLDVVRPNAHDFLQQRALGSNAETVSSLGRAFALGLRNGGVATCIKHAPGHGAASVDSHHDLPQVDLPRPELESIDFAPFVALRKEPMLMTAHILYTHLDPSAPGTLSPSILSSLIREEWGYDGLILTDDLNMKALGGTMEERCTKALDAGCEILCHCNGEREDMLAVARASVPLSKKSQDRARRARHFGRADPSDFNRAEAEDRLKELGLFEATP